MAPPVATAWLNSDTPSVTRKRTCTRMPLGSVWVAVESGWTISVEPGIVPEVAPGEPVCAGRAPGTGPVPTTAPNGSPLTGGATGDLVGQPTAVGWLGAPEQAANSNESVSEITGRRRSVARLSRINSAGSTLMATVSYCQRQTRLCPGPTARSSTSCTTPPDTWGSSSCLPGGHHMPAIGRPAKKPWEHWELIPRASERIL